MSKCMLCYLCLYLFVLLYISAMIYDIFYYFFNFKEREIKAMKLKLRDC